MTFSDKTDELEVRVYQQQAGYKCTRWEWVVFSADGLKRLRSGIVDGSERDARREANAAKQDLYMRERAKSRG